MEDINITPVLIEVAIWAIYVIAFTAVVTLVVGVTLKLWAYFRFIKQKTVVLELTPPANTDKSIEATRRLFSVLHGLDAGRTPLDKLLMRKALFSFEVVSTKEQGIRYLLRVAESDMDIFEQTIASYLPDAKVQQAEDYYTPETAKHDRVLDIRQTGHFAYPLQSQGFIDQHDPMAYLTGTMTKLSPGEFMAAQFVISPVKVREAKTLASRILHNEELLQRLGNPRFPRLERIFAPVHTVLLAVMDGVGETVGGTSGRNRPESPVSAHKQQVALKEKPARVLSQFEQALAESVHDKLSQPLFSVNIRVLAVTENKKRERQRVRGIRDWLALFEVPTYQSLRPRMALPLRPVRRYLSFIFRHRLPSFFRNNTSLLSAGEVAEICHFPHPTAARTENVVKTLSKTLPAPVSLKNHAKFDVVLGRNRHHGTETDIGLTAAERERHVYVIGGTGHGKTTMLQYSIVQDIRNGKGLAVIDPHGDMATNLLRYVPEERLDDVVYFNPADLGRPMGLNLLELPEGASGDELLLEQDFVTEAVVSVFRKIFSDDGSGGHRIEYVLRNAVQTAFSVKGATLFTLYDIINDPTYRKKVVNSLDDPHLKNFWNNEFSKAGDYQRVKMAAGITAKIGRFLRSEVSKRVLEQPKSTINFEDILDGKILICNLSKGMIGEDTSELFGISILAKLQLASLRRARVSQAERKPFYLYVDEFQNFATVSFIEMLSEARKYKLFLTMAEQSTTQQDERRLVDIILANVGTVICFRTGSPADEYMLLPLFKPYVDEGEIANLPSYNFYARLSALHAQEPLSGITLLLDESGTDESAAQTIKRSRELYGSDPVVSKKENASKPADKPRPRRKTSKNSKTKKTQGKRQKVSPEDIYTKK